MFPAEIYLPIYLLIVTIFTFLTLSKYKPFVFFRKNKLSQVPKAVSLSIFFTIFLGFRPVSTIFGDTGSYDEVYQVIMGNRFYLNLNVPNFIFENIFNFFASQNISINYFFLLISTIYFSCTLWACMILFPKDSLLSFIMYLGAFSTYSYGVNGIKAGAAAALFLLAIAYRRKKAIALIFLFLSYGFHHSMLAPNTAFIISYYYKNPKTYLYGWFFCLLLAALHITVFMSLFAGYTDDHGAAYLRSSSQNIVSGFRPDFILYSAIPIILGYYIITTKRYVSENYIFIWQVYTLTNCVFLLCTYGSFINRIAYLSWLLYPFVLLYPFIYGKWGNQQCTYIKNIVYGHLCFTLFMQLFYYQL